MAALGRRYPRAAAPHLDRHGVLTELVILVFLLLQTPLMGLHLTPISLADFVLLCHIFPS
jgi:hypothetical protein